MTTFYNTTFSLSKSTVSRIGATTSDAACVQIGEPIWEGAESLNNTINIWVNGDHSLAHRIVDAINAAVTDKAPATAKESE